MPIAFEFSGKTIRVTLSGQYSFDDMKKAAAAIQNDPALTADMNLLLDARQATVNPTLAEVKERALFLQSVARGRRIAVVVSDSLRYGLTRMLSVFAQMGGLKIEVFMDIEQACGWLEPGSQSPEDRSVHQ